MGAPLSGITTYAGMVDTAMRLEHGPILWLCIAQSSPWPDDNNPPDPSNFAVNPEYINMTSIPQPIAMKRVDQTCLCVPNLYGSINYGGQNYEPVPDDQALIQVARWVNIRASLNYAEMNSQGQEIIGNVTYRQYLLLSGLEAIEGYDQEDVLLPSQVSTIGNIIFVANFIPHYHSTVVREVVNFVKEILG